jgi:hypothetical protein
MAQGGPAGKLPFPTFGPALDPHLGQRLDAERLSSPGPFTWMIHDVSARSSGIDSRSRGAYRSDGYPSLPPPIPVKHRGFLMPLSMYQAAVPVFLQGLTSCSALLDKAAAHAREQGIDPTEMLEARLAPDMFPMKRQVQIASDHAKGAVARLAGLEVPSYQDTETSFEELKDRLSRTAAFVRSIEPARIDGAEDKEIHLAIGGQQIGLKGQPYLLHFALPNFFFHLTTAYALLRARGVPVGKRDFIGPF